MNDTSSRLKQHLGNHGATASSLSWVRQGVTVAHLAEMFGMKEERVRYLLRDCPVKAQAARGTKMKTTLYDIKVASAYLVKPRFTLKDYMRALKKGDLPDSLQDTVWAAMLKRQQWEEKAGLLWHTDKVMGILRRTFQSMKFQIQLFVEAVERNTELTDRQRQIIQELTDGLQNDIYASLVGEAEKETTGPQITELKERFGEDVSLKDVEEIVDEEDDILDLV